MRLRTGLAAAAAIGIYAAASSSPAYGTGHSDNAAVRYAEAQVGCPYTWGGDGPCDSGYDCSGLAMMAERQAGIYLPRTSSEQWDFGRRISESQAKPGDLVFFVGSDGSWSAPGHVGIVIGHGLMVEAYRTGYPIHITSYIGRTDLIGFTDPGSR
jgi:peptidoglycan DL-endopeptidase CwlO